MTEKELCEIEDMLQANFQFLDFTSDTVHNLWMESLQRYDFAEVRAGAKLYIEEQSKTPTLHDILEYVIPIRQRNMEEAEHNPKVLFDNAVHCVDCNDNGYVMVLYPSGDEKCRPCDCKAGHHRFGDRYWKNKADHPGMQPWEKQLLFKADTEDHADREMNRYKLVTVKPFEPKGVIWWKYIKKEA